MSKKKLKTKIMKDRYNDTEPVSGRLPEYYTWEESEYGTREVRDKKTGKLVTKPIMYLQPHYKKDSPSDIESINKRFKKSKKK